MSQAEDLLNSLLEEDTSAYAMEDEPHIVVNSDRTITVPDELKHIAVQFDHNIETVTFDCPRYWDEHDFSKMHVYINYMRPDGYVDQYPVKNLRVDEGDDSIIHFEWVVSKNVTQKKGNISFLVCIKAINDEGEEEPHWNSRLNRDFVIDEGMECYEQIVDNNPDIIEEVLTRIEKIETTGGVTDEQVEAAVNAYLSENPIEDTNAVKTINGIAPDENGNVDITAIEGKPGVSVTHEWDGTVLSVTSASGTSSVDLKGEPGYTPQKNVDYFDGEQGEPGVSPNVVIESISGGHRVTITDAEGPKTFNVMDGVNVEGGVVESPLTLPQFDLSELGLPVIVPNTGAQTLETDTTDIMSALDKGLVKVSFIIRLDVDTQCTSVISPVYLVAKSTYHGFIKWYYNKEYYTVMFDIANGSLSVTAVTDADCSFWVEQAVV